MMEAKDVEEYQTILESIIFDWKGVKGKVSERRASFNGVFFDHGTE